MSAIFCSRLKSIPGRLGLKASSWEQREGKIYLGYREQIYSTDSESDLIRLLFGPANASMLYPFEGEVKKVFDDVFPIPIWVWGWDSV